MLLLLLGSVTRLCWPAIGAIPCLNTLRKMSRPSRSWNTSTMNRLEWLIGLEFLLSQVLVKIAIKTCESNNCGIHYVKIAVTTRTYKHEQPQWAIAEVSRSLTTRIYNLRTYKAYTSSMATRIIRCWVSILGTMRSRYQRSGANHRLYETTVNMSIRVSVVRQKQHRKGEIAQCRRTLMSGNWAEHSGALLSGFWGCIKDIDKKVTRFGKSGKRWLSHMNHQYDFVPDSPGLLICFWRIYESGEEVYVYI